MPSFSFKRFGSNKKAAVPKVVAIDPLASRLSNMTVGPRRSTPTRRPPPPEAPPAYSAAPPMNPSVPVQSSASSINCNASDSPYAFLAQFDTVFLIDDSGSMAGRSWRETSDALAAIAPICTEQDSDGIDIFFLNNRRRGSNLGAYNNIKTTTEVREIFSIARPTGGTPTGQRLNDILKPYLAKVAQDVERTNQGQDSTLKPLNIIVITDGAPHDDPAQVIIQAAKKLDKLDAVPWQVGIQFFQVGNETEATEALKEMDDDLAGENDVRDMVDTTKWSKDNATLTAEGILKGKFLCQFLLVYEQQY